ncbi:MAG: helix-turn-helix type 11 protein, partial [uncultured bacterium]
LGAGYGIFSGTVVSQATLRFTPERARWVAAEQWHPAQQAALLPDGSYQLSIPYSNDPELIMDILKYGADCEVIAPTELREKVVCFLREAVGRYGGMAVWRYGGMAVWRQYH